ncbi:hypothetical protein [Maridesulfovibrio bastinii]|uniref:hypothetical protein n=1 Tax=Maridesulfovibrio bastinii TaxID=47157 RepID=UPI00048451B8|nr:hypothetical protein [Maridesulfovibrio bastinii]
MSYASAKPAIPATSPVGRKIRSAVFELRCISQGMGEKKFAKMKTIINSLEGCALHIEDIEQHLPVNDFLKWSDKEV